MGDRVQTLRLFVEIARLGSFSQGARAMRVSQPTASRLIAQLESELGSTLFLRTARAMALTDRGAAYMARIVPILKSLEDADDEARHGDDLRGKLRVGGSMVVMAQTIVPCLGAFAELYPDLTIELVADDRKLDLLREGIDVAIRFGTLPSSGAIARRIGNWPVVVAAAPGYIDRHGLPIRPEDLRDHSFLVAGPLAGRELVFALGDERVSIDAGGRVIIDNTIVAVEAVKAGLGLCVATLQTFGEHFRTGRLVRLLPDWDLGEIAAHAVYPGGETGKRAARAFVDHLVATIRASDDETWTQKATAG